uniref:Transthyretin-like family protein n=1 Tax=Strongyloides papillosus TaxID=174720 RepID=A0A0N5CGV4_STREA
MYVTGVTGILTCKINSRASAHVVIATKPTRFCKKHVVSENNVHYGFSFFVAGSIKTITKPHFYIKIYHNCTSYRNKFPQTLVEVIPKNYIFKVRRSVQFWNIGKIELSSPYQQNMPIYRKRYSI